MERQQQEEQQEVAEEGEEGETPGLRHVSTETVMASLPTVEAPPPAHPEAPSPEDATPATPTAGKLG